MDDLDLHLALEALRTNPAAHAYHERITRGMQAIEQGTLTPFERDALHRLLARFPISPPADPVAALIAAFQDKLPTYDPAAVATAIQQALAQRPATLNGAPVTIRMDGDTHAHQANLAIGNQVSGNLVQVTIPIPIPDARFDAFLASALRTHEHEKTLARIQHAAQQIESDRLLNLRLQGFVGRVAELAAIREHIAAMRPTGGYVLIKAAAGEGKSSSIAKLIQEAGITQTPHHFIALTTGREYQLGLLRAVVAQLILKHGLQVSYFPEESYPAMKAEFARILDELSKQGIQETIYLDGLDQLQPEIDGSRDLSFLPPQPPPGIVIMLGSRPDETLKPLEILHRIDYDLPPLSEVDALALWRSVQPDVADRLFHDLYTMLNGNALFVFLAADTMRGQSVVDAMTLIRLIEQNPSNLFGITLDRMKGRSLADWRTIWKPMLALLLVSQEPVRLDVLGDLLEHDHDTMQDAVWVLGGLVSQGIDQRVALHHLLFRDFLAASVFNDREVKRWHQRLADWCGADLDTIWDDAREPIEQARRVYARHHYIMHLFLAENWTTLWKVLDAGDYGEQKTRFDPSTRLYALDLDRGREGVIKAGQSIEEHLQNLPRLWKYSLLRTSLTSRVDQWPDDLFVTLAILGRMQEALERIELVSDPKRQIQLWAKIIRWFNRQQQHTIIARMYRCGKDIPYLNRSAALATIAKTAAIIGDFIWAKKLIYETMTPINDWKIEDHVLETIAETMAIIGDFDQAISIVSSIKGWRREKTIATIAQIYASLGNLDQAMTIIATIDDVVNRIKAMIFIIRKAISLGNLDQAVKLIDDTTNIAVNIDNTDDRAKIFASIAKIVILLENFDQATRLIDQAITIATNIHSTSDDAEVFALIAEPAILLGNLDQATMLIDKAISMANIIEHAQTQTLALSSITRIVASFGNIDQAIIIATTINHPNDRIKSFASIARIAASHRDIEQASKLIDVVNSMTNTINTSEERDNALSTIARTTASYEGLDQASIIAASIDNSSIYLLTLETIIRIAILRGNLDQATILIDKAITVVSNSNDPEQQAEVFISIAKTVFSLGNLDQVTMLIDRAIITANSIYPTSERVEVLVLIATFVALTGDIGQATKLIDTAINIVVNIDYDDSEQTEAFACIAQSAFSLGNIAQVEKILSDASSIAAHIDDIKEQIEAFISIAKTAILIGNLDTATRFINTASGRVTNIDDSNERAETLILIAKTAISLGNLNQAVDLVNDAIAITTTTDNLTTRTIACVLASIGNIEQSIIAANTISDSSIKAETFASIAKAAASQGNINQAGKLIDSAITIANKPDTILFIARIAHSLGNIDQATGLINDAISIAMRIDDIGDRAKVFISIIETANSTTNLDQIRTCIKDILPLIPAFTRWIKYSSVFEIVVKIAADLGNINEAISVINRIDIHSTRVKSLVVLGENILSEAEILSIIRNEWSLSKTDDEIWAMASIITPLLKEYPWLGTAILEGEEWVNAQLKRLG